MSIQILATKLYVPRPPPKVVLRPHLIELLNNGLHRKLTLISAPAGFGKTTLVSEWVSGCGRPVAWLSLDARDNDPISFLSYLIAALQTIFPKIGGQSLVALQAPQPPSIESILTTLLNEITSVEDRFVLVFDDYYLLDSKPVDEATNFLIEHLPAHMHLVIASREDPSLPLARLRVRNQLTELRAGDLRFTPAEASEFLNRVMGLNLSIENIQALETRTEGWIAGLQLAALSMQGRTDASSFIQSFTGSNRFVLDYLLEEVLQKQSESIQRFLMNTSILERLSGPLCDAVNPNPCASGQSTLENLERANLFLVALDNERRWYRYHHLFAELLRHRLEQTSPTLVSKLHLQASIWFENENLIEEAVSHAFASLDWDYTADLIQRFAQRVHGQTNLVILGRWLETLPEPVMKVRPWLYVYQALAWHWIGPRERIEERLLLAEQALPKSNMLEAEATRLAGYISTIRAHYALTFGDIPRVLAMAKAAMQQLPEGDYMRRWTAMALGGAYWGEGNVIATQQAFQAAIPMALDHNFPLLAVSPACYVGMQLVKQGKLGEAIRVYHEGIEYATLDGGQQPPIAGFPKVKLGDVLREKNDLAGAEHWLLQGLEQCLQLGHPDLLVDAYAMLIRFQLAQNNWRDADASFQRAEELARKMPTDPFVCCELDDCRVRLKLVQSRLDDLNRWAESSGLTVDSELSYHYDLHHINLARVLLARARNASSSADKTDNLSQASTLLARLLPAAQKAGWVYEAIKILILQALVSAESKDGKAIDSLRSALELAETGGFIRIFVDEGPPMARLLSEAAARRMMPDYVGKLLAAFEADTHRGGEKHAAFTNPSAGVLIEPLSQRELEILRLMAQGLSNREIGQRAFLALDTIKGHNSRIFGKLQVQRRTEAIARARELGLL
ncbi:LuxR family transcriptional regulator, maltose regulon positive regulatory protein [Dehalogenimonas formicexedens]|uniref:LuxR family transcriptional regulator, maltose regulon positive regulatory protein n=1 Tax=Dehalogenimonas formicexedens TaxID=1839801 RepID=A0A1P8F553_9CHLR|nr:LuxR C-terminal-related transcriptional regulator [Dehalogenimonas formicexedens]APV43609.1 LuxR family transcriptional regulator, maltose regulon positive regulatory protein [Dehalogenimonas formicexedens]